VTETELETLRYIMETYKLDKKAQAYLQSAASGSSSSGSSSKRSLSDTDLGSGGASSKRGRSGGKSYYQQIDGVNYDRELLEMAEKLSKSNGGKLDLAAAQKLCQEACEDGRGVTDCEKRTLQYIAQTHKLNPAATTFMEMEFELSA